MNKKRNVRKQFCITPELNDLLKRAAARTDQSENNIVNKALNYYLSRYKKDDEQI